MDKLLFILTPIALIACFYETGILEARSHGKEHEGHTNHNLRNNERPTLYDQLTEESYPDTGLYRHKEYYHYDCEEYCEEYGFPINYPSIVPSE